MKKLLKNLHMNSMRKPWFTCLILGLFLLSGCSTARHAPPNMDTTIQTIRSCQFEDDPLSSVWSFAVNGENQIIAFRLQTDIDEEKLDAMYEDEEEKEEAFAELLDTQNTDYQYIQQTYPKKSWLKSSMEVDEENFEFHVLYSFDVSGESFNYELESSVFEDFGLDSLWNSTQNCFLYDEEKINKALFDNAGICGEEGEILEETPEEDSSEDSDSNSSDKTEENDEKKDEEKTNTDSKLDTDELRDLFSGKNEEKSSDKSDDYSSGNSSKDTDSKDSSSNELKDRWDEILGEDVDAEDVNENVTIVPGK